MSGFWKTWLIVVCWLIVLLGAVLTGAGFAATDAPSRILFERMGGSPPDFQPALRFSTSLMGAVTLGWGLTLVAVVRAAFRIGPAADIVWAPLLGSLVVWYVIDSTLSVATGFALNAASNTLLLVAFALPLIRGGLLRRTASSNAA